jgi:homoserine kinase
VVLTPQFPLSTSASREALPHSITREDAVFNLQRVALLLEVLQSGNYSILREALQDRIHQPFRQKLVPGLERALALEHPDILGVCLSGAGPSIVALAERNLDGVEETLGGAFRDTGLEFTVRQLKVHQNGAGEGGAEPPVFETPSHAL